MESLTLTVLLDILRQFGLPTAFLVALYIEGQRRERAHAQHRDDTAETQDSHRKEMGEIMAQYKDDMNEIRRMYENNVILVKSYENLAKDLHDVVIMNTQAMTRIVDRIDGGQLKRKAL